ncbi:MAG: 6-bladed beta-propeller [Balneolaceae bacterium]
MRDSRIGFGLNRLGGWALLMIIGLAGCADEQEVEIPDEIASLENLTVITVDEESKKEFELVEEAVFGDGDEVFMSFVGDVAIDDRDRVYLSDPREQKVHVFGPDGSHVKTLGGSGGGPGEFQYLFHIQAANGYLHVYDTGQQMVSLYDLSSLDYLRRIDVSTSEDEASEGRPAIPQIQPGGDYWVTFMPAFGMDRDENATPDSWLSVYRVSEERYVQHQVLRFKSTQRIIQRFDGGMTAATAPYLGTLVLSVIDDLLVHAWSRDFLIRFYDQEGSYKKAFYYPYQHIPLTQSDIRTITEDRPEQIRDLLRNNDQIPDTWPAMRYMVADDEGRLWISTFTEDPEIYNWWVIDQEGRRIASFDWPWQREIMAVRNGKVYVRDMEEMGVTIVRYRVEISDS